jgi:hypothetical protein
MKRINAALLVLTFLLAACTTTTPVPDITSATDLPASTESALSVREAILSEVENTVSARKTSVDELITAEQDMSILESGSVETGEDGRVRVDLMPEGTIVRVGPNSAFSLPKLTQEEGEPKTTVELLFGKVFILLKGGTLSVETPSGMEGDCVLQGEQGEEIEIPEGEESFIEDDEFPVDPYPMDQDEVQDWLDENPDLDEFMLELPDPEDYPDLPDDFDGDMEDMETEEGEGFEDGTPPPFEEEEPEEEEPSEDEPSDDEPSEDEGSGDEGEGE